MLNKTELNVDGIVPVKFCSVSFLSLCYVDRWGKVSCPKYGQNVETSCFKIDLVLCHAEVTASPCVPFSCVQQHQGSNWLPLKSWYTPNVNFVSRYILSHENNCFLGLLVNCNQYLPGTQMSNGCSEPVILMYLWL